ncbi:hypothetical protein TSMG0039 [Halocynthia phage JM-2012]|uniref:hypothetical protein n=1 Tax=Halocynthia phage JM-2012 TaxID=1173297 RepID=UPI00025C68F6|nr:hypothetical protein TSMG0039 [Halocynthia phage JM-2012]AFI55322.1 hypothetical protein TSMG0039 [Halocynthia phage JM-2012]
MSVQTASEVRALDKTAKAIKKNVTKTKINTNQVINWALLTAEFQTAYKVAPSLRKVLPDNLIFKMEERVRELETLQQQELLMAFNIATTKNQLATTPIYPIAEPDVMFEYYMMSVADYGQDDFGMGMRDVGLVRHQSDVLFTANAPVFKIAQFFSAPGYVEMLADESITDEKLTAIHLTLMQLFCVKSSEYNDLLSSGLLDQDTVVTLQLDDVII